MGDLVYCLQRKGIIKDFYRKGNGLESGDGKAMGSWLASGRAGALRRHIHASAVALLLFWGRGLMGFPSQWRWQRLFDVVCERLGSKQQCPENNSGRISIAG